MVSFYEQNYAITYTSLFFKSWVIIIIIIMVMIMIMVVRRQEAGEVLIVLIVHGQYRWCLSGNGHAIWCTDWTWKVEVAY